MILDKEIHREALLQMLAQSTFPGNVVDVVYELKQAILAAQVQEQSQPVDPAHR